MRAQLLLFDPMWARLPKAAAVAGDVEQCVLAQLVDLHKEEQVPVVITRQTDH